MTTPDLRIDPQDTVVLILARYGGHWEMDDYPDSRVIRANCGHQCWVSARGEPYIEASYTTCQECAGPVMEDPSYRKVAAKGALDSLEHHFGTEHREGVKRLMDRLGIME